jgi:hypothetical protein
VQRVLLYSHEMRNHTRSYAKQGLNRSARNARLARPNPGAVRLALSRTYISTGRYKKKWNGSLICDSVQAILTKASARYPPLAILPDNKS